MTSRNRKKRYGPFVLLLAAALLAAAVLAAAAPASAQTTQTDPRWRAWIGCWLASPPTAARAQEMVCVVPASGSAVDIVTLKDGKESSRDHIDATGARRDSRRDDCTGWERAQWSADSRRVYLQSEYQCANGITRTSSGLMAMTLEREWLDVMSVTVARNTGVRVLRHSAAAVPDTFPADIRSPIETAPSSAIDEARALAASPIGVADIIEAAKAVNPAAVEAWIGEIREHFKVDAKQLIDFAKAGVPDRVIDMMVALSYPGAFAIAPSATTAGELAENRPRRGGGAGFTSFDDPMNCGFGYSLFGWDGCSPFGYSAFTYAPFGLPYAYYPYSYSRGGYGYPYGGYGGWYLGEPTVIVLKPGDGQGHGQVVNGRGYSSGNGGSTATTSSEPASTGGSAGSSSSGGSSAESSGGGGGDSGRTAQPR